MSGRWCWLALTGALWPVVAIAEPASVGVEVEEIAADDAEVERFELGSYGRLAWGSNLAGGTGRQVEVVRYAPRLLEGPYVELDLGYRQPVAAGRTLVISRFTLALGERIFHFDGDFAADLALRNLYVEARGVGLDGLSVWVGSRMLRGDDIYLLDFWPLDEQNTVGGGVDFTFGATHLGWHLGVNRLSDRFQTQLVTVPAETFGTREVLYLDRQRVVSSLRAEHVLAGERWRLKPVLYGEVHALPAGQVRLADGRDEAMPDDHGFLAGAELGLAEVHGRASVNLFTRVAGGLAIFDELGVPFGVDPDKRAAPAREFLAGLSAHLEHGERAGLLAGAYARYFVDADPNRYDRDDGWEAAVAVRPAWYVTEVFHLLAEANLQYLRPNGLSPVSYTHERPVALQLGLMPAVSLGHGSLSRPQLRLVAAVTLLDQGARHLYAELDPRRTRAAQYFLGANVEWWFNSSRYGGES